MSFIPALRRTLGATQVRTDSATLKKYSSDAWLASHLPDAVILARSSATVQKVMRFATRHKVPVTVRGAGVGYVGGCVPIRGGIVLSLEKLRRIKEVNVEDGVIVAEPGVLTIEVQEAARACGLFYPPDPASLRESTIGGNIATNAGGPRCVRYGVTRHYVLGLEVVLANGEILRVGGRTHKNKTGFDLVGLFVGSEGLLGIVTEVTLRLIPHPPARACISAAFSSEEKAARGVQQILASGFLPSALEIADRLTLEAARLYTSELKKNNTSRNDLLEIPAGQSYVLVEVDGQACNLKADVGSIRSILKKSGARTIKTATREADCERIWDIRRVFSTSLKSKGLTKLNEDVTVPRSRLVDLFRFARKLQAKYGFEVACFGHAGDGNIHVNLMIDIRNPQQVKRSKRALDELFRQVIAWKGAITGEHGIGMAKQRWWKMAVSQGVRDLHVRLKKAVDPSSLLNPGKFV